MDGVPAPPLEEFMIEGGEWLDYFKRAFGADLTPIKCHVYLMYGVPMKGVDGICDLIGYVATYLYYIRDHIKPGVDNCLRLMFAFNGYFESRLHTFWSCKFGLDTNEQFIQKLLDANDGKTVKLFIDFNSLETRAKVLKMVRAVLDYIYETKKTKEKISLSKSRFYY